MQMMARVMGVSRSGFHAWAKRPPSARAMADSRLSERIGRIHGASKKTYGAPRIHAELADDGIGVGRKRVERLMKAAALVGVSRRKGTRTTIREDRVRPANDLVDRNFRADQPNQLWVADITYVPTWAGFIYPSVVLDAWSRRIVGWSMGHDLKAQLVIDAMNMAIHCPTGHRAAMSRKAPNGGRQTSSIIATKDLNTHPWRSDCAARRPASVRQWARSATHMTTRCARASSPRSNASCSTGASSEPRPRPAWPASSSSKAGITRRAVTRRSAINLPSRSKGARRNSYDPLLANCPRNRGNSNSSHGVSKRRKRRIWSDDEKRAICGQTRVAGVSVSQVARRYDVNANLVFTWLRDARFAFVGAGPDESAVEPSGFLPVQIVDRPQGEEPISTSIPGMI